MSTRNVIQETESQATGVITEILKTIRIDEMKSGLARELQNKEHAEKLMAECKESIKKVIDSNRGGTKGMHGFIGERAQCYICNIKSVINGEKPLYILIDDNGMTDYLCDGVKVQQKACMSNGHLGLDQILEHIKKYPVFKEQQGKYQIPKDLYRKYKTLSELPESAAGKLLKEDYRLWKYITEFKEASPDTTIEPMIVNYSEIQAGKIFDTLDRVEAESLRTYNARRKIVIDNGKPTLQEGIKVTAISSAMEGATSCLFTIIDKAKEGKKPTTYCKEDWKELGKNTVIGTAKGGARGATIYVLTNIANTPTPVAAAVASVVVNATADTIQFAKGELDKEKYIRELAMNIGGASASAAGAMIAKNIMRTNPIAGIIGGLAGNICWQVISHLVITPMLEECMEEKTA